MPLFPITRALISQRWQNFNYKYRSLSSLAVGLSLYSLGFGFLSIFAGVGASLLAGYVITARAEAALKRAARSGDLEKTKFLINFFTLDVNGWASPLCFAAMGGHIQTMRMLINEFRANPNGTEFFRYSPLQLAALHGRCDAARLLVNECHVDVNSTNQFNKHSIFLNTPLSYAAIRGQTAMVQVLVTELHANIDARSADGHTAHYYAMRKGHIETANVLTMLSENSSPILEEVSPSVLTAFDSSTEVANEQQPEQTAELNPANVLRM